MRRPGTWLAAALLLAARAGAASAWPTAPVATLAEGLSAPTAVEATADRIAVLDPYRDRLVVYTADGALETRLHLSGRAAGLAALPGGAFVLCDRETGALIHVDPATGVVGRCAPAGAGMDPQDLRVIGGSVRVLDAAAAEILTLDAGGAVRERTALVDAAGRRLVCPTSFTALDGEIFVLDQPASRIHVYDGAGAHRREFCSFGAGEAEVTRGGCLRADPRGLIYLADRFQGRVAVFDAAGDFQGVLEPDADGADRLRVPVGLAVDGDGLLYVSSAEGGRVDVFAMDGTPSSVPFAAAVSPSGTEVPPEAPALVAEAAFPGPPAAGVRMDLRLWPAADAAEPVATTEALDAERDPGSPDAAPVYRAVWRPNVDLRPATEYAWSARVRVGAQTGPWSGPWTFSTIAAPRGFALEQNRPNPFAGRTTIAFTVPEAGDVRLAVYDLRGREIWSRELRDAAPGRHEETWTGLDRWGRPAPPGLYFCRLTAGGRTDTRKMVITGGRP